MALSQLPEVEQLDLARVELPVDHPAAALGRSVDVHGFLIRHPDGPILVDTGVGFDNELIDALYRPTRVELGDVLAGSGVDVRDVVAVVNSHLHFDHCGQNPLLFDSATAIYAEAAEFDAVEADPLYTDARWALAPPVQRRTVVGDERIADGVTILATPGHTAGHQSVLVEGGGRRVVIGAQVVWRSEELRDEIASPRNVDADPGLQTAAVESIRRIKALAPELVHLSHCAAYRPTLSG